MPFFDIALGWLKYTNRMHGRCWLIWVGVLCINLVLIPNIHAQTPNNIPPGNGNDVQITEPIEATPEIFYRKHSPQKATMLSATLPGLGQIYNGKYWKVPIIYGGYAFIGYLLQFNNEHYQLYRKAYSARVDGNPNTVSDERYALFPTERLRSAMNYYRRNLEITYISAFALYVLNVLDATVDAHLLDFDVSEDLTLKVQPSLIPSGHQAFGLQKPVAGLKFTFRF